MMSDDSAPGSHPRSYYRETYGNGPTMLEQMQASLDLLWALVPLVWVACAAGIACVLVTGMDPLQAILSAFK